MNSFMPCHAQQYEVEDIILINVIFIVLIVVNSKNWVNSWGKVGIAMDALLTKPF